MKPVKQLLDIQLDEKTTTNYLKIYKLKYNIYNKMISLMGGSSKNFFTGR